ncbi:hypothetical protein ACRAS4_32420 [Streptomyces lividans]
MKTFDEVALYPRADVLTDDGRIPGLPVDYTVSAADSADGPATRLAAVSGQRQPTPYLPAGLPCSPTTSPCPSGSAAPASTSPGWACTTRP